MVNRASNGFNRTCAKAEVNTTYILSISLCAAISRRYLLKARVVTDMISHGSMACGLNGDKLYAAVLYYKMMF
jgi:hypothetical protein